MEIEPPTDKFAIHAAAREGRLQVVESLLNANPKLAKLVDDDERLPIHWACAYNHLDIVKILSSTRSFDPDVQDASGWTPLMIASSLKDNVGIPAIDLLLAKEADVKTITTTGGTALHFATSKNNLEVVRKLIAVGASARAKDKRGQLPLHRAAAVGNVPIVKALLQAKSPVDATDMDGLTALHHAVLEGHGDVAIELMRAGADTGKRDVDGALPIDSAPDSKIRNFILQAAEAEGIEVVEEG